MFVVFSLIIAIAAGVFLFVRNNVTPMIITISNEQIKRLTSDAVGSAILDVMSESTSVEYLSVKRDDKNNITSVDLDSSAVTDLAQKITLQAQKNINSIGTDGIKIPVGSLSGVTLFTGLGPDINIKIYLVGSTQTQITSEFTEAGINQTLHRLYLNIKSSVAVAVPGLPSTVNTVTQALMSEMIIVGDVPQTYLKSTSVGDLLDLAAG